MLIKESAKCTDMLVCVGHILWFGGGGGEAWMQLEGNYGVLDADDGWKYLMLEA